MKKTIFLILAIFLLSVHAFAQDDKTQAKPDFSGTWVFDEKGSSADGKLYRNYTLVISHTEPEMKITRSAIFMDEDKFKDIILYTDKRGEKNRPYFTKENPEVISKTFWKKGILISQSRQRAGIAGIEFSGETTDKYSLSEDKKTLIITSSIRFTIPSADNFNNKWVFRKKD